MDSDQVTKYNKMINDSRIQAILRAQSNIESSGGKNLLGKEINDKMHGSDKAVGEWQLTPKTIRDLAQESDLQKDKEVQELASLASSEDMLDYIKQHPGVDKRIATNYVEHSNKSMGGDYDPEKITYGWQWGQNKTAADFEKHKNDPKVQERWSKVKSMFNDPYPPQGPPSPTNEQRELAANPIPNPVPNTSPEIDNTPAAPDQSSTPSETPEIPDDNKFKGSSNILSPKEELVNNSNVPSNPIKQTPFVPEEQPQTANKSRMNFITPRLMRMLMSQRKER